MNREAYIGWRLYQYYEGDYLSFDYKQAVFQFTSLQVNKEKLLNDSFFFLCLRRTVSAPLIVM